MYQSSGGQYSKYPFGKQAAIDKRKKRYTDDKSCSSCNHPTPIRSVKNDLCASCVKVDADALSVAINDNTVPAPGLIHDLPAIYHLIKLGLVMFRTRRCADYGHLPIIDVKTERCYFCELEKQKPTPRQQAITNGESTYIPDTPCKKCDTMAPRRVDNGRCSQCETNKKKTRAAAPLTPRQQAIANGESTYIPDTPCDTCNTMTPRRVNNGRCMNCEKVAREARKRNRADAPLTPRQQAIANGESTYIPDTQCIRCNTVAPRRVDNGRCRGCEEMVREARKRNRADAPLTPRQQAFNNGEPEYTSNRQCVRCGYWVRDTNNGKCVRCEAHRAKPVHSTKQFMIDNPTVVISRTDARTAGFKVFRTGEPCRHGHKGFRYVSTKGCVDCLKE